MNRLVVVFQPELGVKNGFQFFPFDVKERKRLNRRGLVNRGNAGNQVADVPDLLDRHGMFVLRDRKHTKSVRCILSGGHGNDAREGLNPRGVNGFYSCVVVR